MQKKKKKRIKAVSQRAFPVPSETDIFLAVRRHAKCTVTPPTMMQIWCRDVGQLAPPDSPACLSLDRICLGTQRRYEHCKYGKGKNKCWKKDYTYGKLRVGFSFTGYNRSGSGQGASFLVFINESVHLGVKHARLSVYLVKVLKEQCWREVNYITKLVV